MNENKAITYSLLAHVRNTGTLMKGPIDAFVPLIKRTLYKLNSKGILKGKSIQEIHLESQNLYSIDFPIPVLKIILTQIANEVNTEENTNFQIYNDGSFILKDFYFEEFEEKIIESKREIESIEKLFVEFAHLQNYEIKGKTSIFDFIDKNKISISKYLSNNNPQNNIDFTIEAQFVDYFKKIPDVFDIIRRIYLGSIISSYLEYKTDKVEQDVELLFDTNFIISLLDLNTPESTHTCNKLIEVCKNLGYKFTILVDTIDEIKNLIIKKAENFSYTILSKRINPEDIYNACERRNLNKNDLERIVDNIENILKEYGINIIPYTEKLKNQAKISLDYTNLKKVRTSHYAALHDATALFYVREKRKKKIKEFEKVNCWFVNNSITHDTEELKEESQFNNDFQNEVIRADELLNILWLTNPSINKSINNDDLIEIGLSSIVALTLNNSLPKASIIKELDENIQKYKSDIISDKDILLISSRISNRQLKNINELNSLADKNQDLFARKIKEEAQKQEKLENERVQKLEIIFQRFEKQISSLDKARQDLKAKKNELEKEITTTTETANSKDNQIAELQNRLLDIERQRKKDKEKQLENERKIYIDSKVTSWRQKTNKEFLGWLIFSIVGILAILWKSEWSVENAILKYKELQSDFLFGNFIIIIAFIFSGVTFKKWYDKNHNFSNIENYKKGLEIPENLKDNE